MTKVVGVRIGTRECNSASDDVPANCRVEWHARGDGVTDHNTLCGLDADDPVSGHFGIVKAEPGQKITCRTCRLIWRGVMALRLRASDFAVPE